MPCSSNNNPVPAATPPSFPVSGFLDQVCQVVSCTGRNQAHQVVTSHLQDEVDKAWDGPQPRRSPFIMVLPCTQHRQVQFGGAYDRHFER